MKHKITLRILELLLCISSFWQIKAQDFTLGTTFSTALCDNNLYVSGNGAGQGSLGLGTANLVSDYTLFSTVFSSPIQKVISNDFSTLVLLQNGYVWAFGNNSTGQLGNGNLTDQPLPVQILGINGVGFLNNIIDIDTSDYGGTSLAIDSQNRVIQWGKTPGVNASSGANPHYVIDNATQVPLTNISKIAAGEYTSIALDMNGNVFSWGFANGGLLGNPLASTSTEANEIPNFSNMTHIDISITYAVAIRNDGTVWAWGRNDLGQLGIGTNVNFSLVPVQVVSPNNTLGFFQNAVDIVTNYSHTFVIRNDGTLWSWGQNLLGVLGNNTIALSYSSNRPIQVQNSNGNGFLQNVTKIVTSKFTAIATLGIVGCDTMAWGSTNNNIVGQGFGPQYQILPKSMNLNELSCCSGLGGGVGTISGYNVSETTICPNNCVTVEAIVGSGSPTIDSWIAPGASSVSNTSGLITEICYDTPGVYNILALEPGGGNPSVVATITVREPQPNTFICATKNDEGEAESESTSNKQAINVFPNPSKSIFNIQLEIDNTKSFSYSIKDIYGKELILNSKENKNQFKIDLTSFRPGIYILEIYYGEEKYSEKLIKE